MSLNYGNGENVWMHPPVHRILGWYSRPSNFDLKRNVWRLNQISQIIDNEIYVKGDPAISDLATLNRFPTLIEANLININGSKIGVIADFLFEMKTGKIKYYLVSRSNPKFPGSSRWKLNIENINDQQPGLVFCESNSLNDLSLIKSSIKNQFFQKGKIGSFYNIGSNINKTNIEVTKSLLKIARQNIKIGKNVKIKFVKDRPGHDVRYALNSNKIKKQ